MLIFEYESFYNEMLIDAEFASRDRRPAVFFVSVEMVGVYNRVSV